MKDSLHPHSVRVSVGRNLCRRSWFFVVLALASVFVISGHRAFESISLAQSDQNQTTPAVPPLDRVERVQAAGDGQNLWFLRPRQQVDSTWFRIAHHHPAMGTGVARDVLVVQSRPFALVAVEDSIYCIFAPPAPGSGAVRTRQVSRARAMDVESVPGFAYESLNQTGRILQPLPGEGTILGVADDGSSPYVLIRLPEKTNSEPDRPSGEESATPSNAPSEQSTGNSQRQTEDQADEGMWFDGLSGLTLLRYRIGSWDTVALPEAIQPADKCALLPGFRPVLLVADEEAGSDDLARAYFMDADDQWRGPHPVNLDLSRIETACEFIDQTVIALSTDDRSAVELVLLRPTGVFPIGRFDQHSQARRVVRAPETLALMDLADEQSNLRLLAIDLATGEVLSTTVMNQQLQLRQEDLSLLIIVGALLLTFIVMFIARPDPTKIKVVLPPTVVIAEPRRRLFATLIDLSLSGVIVLIVFQGSLIQLLNWPPIARTLDDSILSMATIAITVFHETIAELIWGKTIGKSLSNCQVMSIAGGRPRVGQILLRNAMKLVALFVPPLALFVFMNPYRQRLGDVVARTVVVVEREHLADGSSPGEHQDRSDDGPR